MRTTLRKIKKRIEVVYYSKIKKQLPQVEIINLIHDSNLFDYDFYIENYLKHPSDKKAAIKHYLIAGVKLKYNPNPFFDTDYYLTQYSDVRKAKFNPLLHYIIYGWKEGRNPSAEFNNDFYLNKYRDVRDSMLNPLFHYLSYGKQEGRLTTDPKAKMISIPADHAPLETLVPNDFESVMLDVIKQSGLFDEEYYLGQLKSKVSEPVKHYVFIGTELGLDPSAYFKTNYYLSENADVKEAGINPLFHYILYGFKESRNPGPDFDTDLYLELYSDVKMAGLNPLYHYIYYGRKEGRGANRASIEDPNTYLGWVKNYDLITKDDIIGMKGMIKAFKQKPLISIITPVYNPDIKYLKLAIDSVISQVYDNWELCLADDASTDPEVKDVLDEYAGRDKRIKVTYRKKNGHISEASNSAIEIATGDYLLLLDQDDELPKHTAFMVAHAINEDPDICLIYSDEDKIDVNGYRHGPYFKSDWNKDLFYGHNMISHLGVYKTSIVKKIGGFRKGYEGSQDYDLAHRLIEQIELKQIKHIPHVLYHWRTLPGSTAHSMESKNYAYDAALRGLSDHLIRTKQNAKVITAPHFGYRVKWEVPGKAPLVSIIIPIKDKADFLKKCITSITKKTNYKNYEIIIVDNNSKEEATEKYLNKLKSNGNIQVIKYEGDFNYSAINNAAVKVAKGEIIGLLNNDVEVINEDWLAEIVSHAVRKEAGAIGAKLYYSNDTIQHAGIVLGIHTVGNHVHKNFERNSAGYLNKAQLTQNFSAVTGACLFVRKAVYEEVGGLDEVNLKIAYNDVDFCLKLREKGYINIWTPFAELYHHESVSRGKETAEHNQRFEAEIKYMYKKWGHIINNDPYYNPNLSNDSVEYRLAVPPRLNYPWRKERSKETEKVIE